MRLHDEYAMFQCKRKDEHATDPFCLVVRADKSTIHVDKDGVKLEGFTNELQAPTVTIMDGARFAIENGILSISCPQLSLSGPVPLVRGSSTTAQFNLEMFAREANLILGTVE